LHKSCPNTVHTVHMGAHTYLLGMIYDVPIGDDLVH